MNLNFLFVCYFDVKAGLMKIAVLCLVQAFWGTQEFQRDIYKFWETHQIFWKSFEFLPVKLNTVIQKFLLIFI